MQDEQLPYVLWGPERCRFLGLRASGLSIPECLNRLDDSTTDADIEDWLGDPTFAIEHERMRLDPMRFHRLIAVPMKIIKLDLLDLAYLDSDRAVKHGFSAKARELIMQERGLLEPQPTTGDAWQAILTGMSAELISRLKALPPPPELIDIEPAPAPKKRRRAVPVEKNQHG